MRGEYSSVSDLVAALAAPAAAVWRFPGIVCGQAVHPGKRGVSEDAVASTTVHLDPGGQGGSMGVFIVADGLGGHLRGNEASSRVVRFTMERIVQGWVAPSIKTPMELWRLGLMLVDTIREAGKTLYLEWERADNDVRPATTAVAGLVIGNTVFIASVGDSRAYLLHNGRLEQVTRDHSVAARMAEMGLIDHEDIRVHPRRKELYRALGVSPYVNVDLFIRAMNSGDRLVLCTDGLWGVIPDAGIASILNSARTPQQACDALVQAARRSGGTEDIAVAVVEVG
jgi:protein phosphatase